jgi:hypothetical protein
VIFASTNLLGIAIADRVVACAELTGRGDRATVKRAATFVLPPDLSLEKPEQLGQAFGAFLKEQGFSASHAIIGIPAKWVIAVEKEVPPASHDQVVTLLRLQAERLPLAENGELAFDYAGEHTANKPGRVLLIAMLSRQVERLRQTMEAAEIEIEAITPTALAMASVAASRPAAANHALPMVMLAKHGAEVVWQREGMPRGLRHFGLTIANGHGPSLAPLGQELRRAVALTSTGTNGHAVTDELLLWDGIGLDSSQVAELSERMGVRVRAGDGLALLGMQNAGAAVATKEPANKVSVGQYTPAIALAMAGTNPALLPLNLADSKLAPPKVRRFGTKTVWVSVVVALLVIGVSALLVSNNLLERQLATLKEEHLSHSAEIGAARVIQDRVNVSNAFLEKRSPVLECLREIAETFQYNDPMWTTSFVLQEDRDNKDMSLVDGRIEGKTTDPNTPFRMTERLKENPRFSRVQPPSLTPTAGGVRGREQLTSFNIAFRYTAASLAPAAPATQPAPVAVAAPATAPTTNPGNR